MRVTTYGPGGYDPAKPNNNIVSETDVPDQPGDPYDPAARIAALEAEVQAIKDRAKAVNTADPDAAKVRDAITGKPA